VDWKKLIKHTPNTDLSIHGSLSTGCRIRFSEDFHSHICHDAHLRIQWGQKGMEVLQMLRRKAEKRIVELSPDEARLLREALLAFRNKLLSAGKPTEDVNELIIKVMK
jgi:hypothetical protein